MVNHTANYNFNLPEVNTATDEDLWGGYLNENWTDLDSYLNLRTQDYNFADYSLIRPTLKDYSETIYNAGNVSGATTLDYTNGPHQRMVLTGAVVFTFSNPPATSYLGAMLLYLKQDGTGSRTATWPGSLVWPGGTTPSLTATANRTDIILVTTYDAGTTWEGSVRGLNYNR